MLRPECSQQQQRMGFWSRRAHERCRTPELLEATGREPELCSEFKRLAASDAVGFIVGGSFVCCRHCHTPLFAMSVVPVAQRARGRNPAVPAILVAAWGLGCRLARVRLGYSHARVLLLNCLPASLPGAGETGAATCAVTTAAKKKPRAARELTLRQVQVAAAGTGAAGLESLDCWNGPSQESRAGSGIIQLNRQHRAVPFAHPLPPFHSHTSGLVALRAWASRPSIRISCNRRSPYTPPTQRIHHHLSHLLILPPLPLSARPYPYGILIRTCPTAGNSPRCQTTRNCRLPTSPLSGQQPVVGTWRPSKGTRARRFRSRANRTIYSARRLAWAPPRIPSASAANRKRRKPSPRAASMTSRR